MILLEVIATSSTDCTAIEQNGGNRIELVSALEMGGLTPSLGLLIEARRATKLPIMAMVRPRASGFCYTRSDFATMLRDVESVLSLGADGVVFGCLHEDGTVDEERTRQIVRLAGNKETVFHRAFDVTPEPARALEQLIDLGVTRILTSGQEPSARAGVELIARLARQAAGRIEVLPGSGVNLDSVTSIVKHTGVDQIHASLSGAAVDPSTAARSAIRFGTGDLPDDRYRIADPAAIRQMRALLDTIGDQQ
ncbi:MAG: copper homeostasis protein CutC [Caldilineaceae bacterium]|nr:copper homeostasis protein CutC [Caldilineaceae bacterium]